MFKEPWCRTNQMLIQAAKQIEGRRFLLHTKIAAWLFKSQLHVLQRGTAVQTHVKAGTSVPRQRCVHGFRESRVVLVPIKRNSKTTREGLPCSLFVQD